MTITLETTVSAPIEKDWRAWNTPDDVKQWNTASEDWRTTQAAVDLRVDGSFSSCMEAKDGSTGFDFAGTKVKAMTDGFQDVPLDEVRALKLPTMFILGDANMVMPEHAVALFRAVGGGVFGDMVASPPSRLASCQEQLILASCHDLSGSRRW